MIELYCEYLSLQCIWMHVIVMSPTSFRVNQNSIVFLNFKELLSFGEMVSVRLRTKWLWVQITLLLLKLEILRHLRARSFLTFRQTIECGFTLKLVRDMIITYNQMHRRGKYSKHSSIIWPVWPNGWVFVYEPSGCDFESCCCHLNFRYGDCFEQGVPWDSGKL